MLVTAGNLLTVHMMTANWGDSDGYGTNLLHLSSFASRYTYEFIEERDYFTLHFMIKNTRISCYAWIQSGREMDKMHDSGLNPSRQE